MCFNMAGISFSLGITGAIALRHMESQKKGGVTPQVKPPAPLAVAAVVSVVRYH